MPLPRWVARLNKRYSNRLIEPIVRRTPGFAVVTHTGRLTGTAYRTPVYAFDADGSLLVALTYGPSADWVQNVLVTDAAIHHKGIDYPIETATLADRDVAWSHLPWFVRAALRLLRVTDFLQIPIRRSP